VRETKIAIVADVGSLQRLPAIIGKGHVAELAYTGKDVSAERAAAIGLVNHVSADAEAVVAYARAMAAEIAANSPLAVQGTKPCGLRGPDRGRGARLRRHLELGVPCLGRPGRGDGRLMEKRPANFTGN